MCVILISVMNMNRLYKHDIFPDRTFHIDRTLINDNGRTAPHSHDFYELFIVEEGTLEHERNHEIEIMTPDSMALIYPEDAHAFVRRDSQTLRFFNIAFSQEMYAQAWELVERYTKTALPAKHTVVLPHELSRQFLRRMKWLRNESHQLPEAIQHTLLVTLLVDMITVVAVGSGPMQQMPLWLRTACEGMRKAEHMVGGIARFVALSGKTQEHLTRSMKKHCGQTPSAYVNTIRLERAAELLSATDKSVFDIMLDVGFQNTSYFNKLFKEKYHMSPRKYRVSSLALFGKTK